MLWFVPRTRERKILTQPAIDDCNGAVELLDGLAVLVGEGEVQTQLAVGLSQETAVRGQVLLLQGQTLLEVLHCLWVVPWDNQKTNG